MNASTRPTTAVLLVNLGTPDAPRTDAIRRYLQQFLTDPRVVQLPRLLWRPLLHGVVLPLRCKKVAEKYAKIWLDDGSPLAVYTRQLSERLAAHLPHLHVDWAMRYGNPSLHGKLAALQQAGIRNLVILPLYPQYSTTTTASVTDVLEQTTLPPFVHVVEDYHDDTGWQMAIADSIRRFWQHHGQGQRLLFSYHGIPQRLVAEGDPYAHQCAYSTAAIANLLQLPDTHWQICFQSRFGAEKWLQPYTRNTLQALAAEGVKTVDVICPGFAVDCLETLEEIRIENAEVFKAAGGEQLRYIACLNDSLSHVESLFAIVQKAVAELGD